MVRFTLGDNAVKAFWEFFVTGYAIVILAICFAAFVWAIGYGIARALHYGYGRFIAYWERRCIL
jgi:hypothetical protein